MSSTFRILVCIALSFGAIGAMAQTNCGSGLASVNLINRPPVTVQEFTDTTDLLSTDIGLIRNAGSFWADSRIVVEIDAFWSNGVPRATSNTSYLTLNVNGTDYYQVTTPAGAGDVATARAINGAARSVGADSLDEGVAERVLVQLPTSVKQITSISFNFQSTGPLSSVSPYRGGDDGGFIFVAAWACPQAARLGVTKDNSATSLTSGTTTTYTVSFTNGGPHDASNSVAKDTPSAGLSNCVATCASATGGASCPTAALNNIFTNGGLQLNDFPANSSINFRVACRVTATGR